MRVLQFSFGADEGAEEYRPHNYPRRSLVYTGTHDNDTTLGWFRAGGAKAAPGVRAECQVALKYLPSNGKEFHWDMIRAALRAASDTAIIPVQDLLGLGAEARMNLPGDPDAGWSWRLTDGQLTPEIGARLQDLSKLYGRKPPKALNA